MPVYEGFTLMAAVHPTDLTGSALTQYLRKMLNESGYSINTTAQREVVREIKEKPKSRNLQRRRKVKQRTSS